MSTGLLFDADQRVEDYLFSKYPFKFKYDRAIGLVDNNCNIVGGVFLHSYNGHNVDISYYGKNTMTLGVIRTLAQFIIKTFDASRLTAVTNKRNKQFVRALQKIGFKMEGAQRCYYGKQDTTRNTGIRLVLFRDKLDVLAKRTERLRECS